MTTPSSSASSSTRISDRGHGTDTEDAEAYAVDGDERTREDENEFDGQDDADHGDSDGTYEQDLAAEDDRDATAYSDGDADAYDADVDTDEDEPAEARDATASRADAYGDVEEREADEDDRDATAVHEPVGATDEDDDDPAGTGATTAYTTREYGEEPDDGYADDDLEDDVYDPRDTRDGDTVAVGSWDEDDDESPAEREDDRARETRAVYPAGAYAAGAADEPFYAAAYGERPHYEERDDHTRVDDTAVAPQPAFLGGAAAGAATATAAAPRTTTKTKARHKPRRVRLAVARVDPWSVMKMSFLLSVAVGIAGVVLTGVLWMILSTMNVFSDVEGVLQSLQTTTDTPFSIKDYVGFGRVLSLSVVIGVIDVILMTAIATVMAFLYNICSALVGGIQLTLTDD